MTFTVSRCGIQRILHFFRQETRSIGTIRIVGRVRGKIGRFNRRSWTGLECCHCNTQWQRIGRAYLGLDDEGMEAAIAADELMEVIYGEEG